MASTVPVLTPLVAAIQSECISFLDQASLSRLARTSSSNRQKINTDERRLQYLEARLKRAIYFRRRFRLQALIHFIHVYLMGPVCAFLVLIPTVLVALRINGQFPYPAPVILAPYMIALLIFFLGFYTARCAERNRELHTTEEQDGIDRSQRSAWGRQWQHLEGLSKAMSVIPSNHIGGGGHAVIFFNVSLAFLAFAFSIVGWTPFNRSGHVFLARVCLHVTLGERPKQLVLQTLRWPNSRCTSSSRIGLRIRFNPAHIPPQSHAGLRSQRSCFHFSRSLRSSAS